eukprot:scaffold250505_cov30-Tisochrysis_lutea.AAC.2
MLASRLPISADGRVCDTRGRANPALNAEGHPLVARDTIPIGCQLGHAGLPHLLLADPLGVGLGFSGIAVERNARANRRLSRRHDKLKPRLPLGAEHHPLGLDAAHLLGAEVAQDHHTSAAHCINGKVLGQAGEHLESGERTGRSRLVGSGNGIAPGSTADAGPTWRGAASPTSIVST